MKNATAAAKRVTADDGESEEKGVIVKPEQLHELVMDIDALREYQRRALAYLATDVYDDANRWMREE